VAIDNQGMSTPAGTVYIDNGRNNKAYALTSILNGYVRLRAWDGTGWQE